MLILPPESRLQFMASPTRWNNLYAHVSIVGSTRIIGATLASFLIVFQPRHGRSASIRHFVERAKTSTSDATSVEKYQCACHSRGDRSRVPPAQIYDLSRLLLVGGLSRPLAVHVRRQMELVRPFADAFVFPNQQSRTILATTGTDEGHGGRKTTSGAGETKSRSGDLNKSSSAVGDKNKETAEKAKEHIKEEKEDISLCSVSELCKEYLKRNNLAPEKTHPAVGDTQDDKSKKRSSAAEGDGDKDNEKTKKDKVART